jgi:hypothetical protein
VTALTTGILGSLADGRARAAAALVATVISALVVATVSGLPVLEIFREPLQPVQLFAAAIGIALAGVIHQVRTHLLFSRGSLAVLVLFIALPYAYAFGTNNNYGTTAPRVGLFWLLASFAAYAAAGNTWRKLLPVAAVSLVVPTGVLYSAMEDPYRQSQPLRVQSDVVDVGAGQSRLYLSEEAASYIRRLQEASRANGFRAGDPVLDLTGVSPGSLYAMGARPLGVAWTLGGYPGTADYVAAALDHESCSAIAASWLLTEPGSQKPISADFLARFGIDVARDYIEVGSIASRRSFAPQKFEQRLLRPTRSLDAARQACEAARKDRQVLDRPQTR